MANAWLPVYEDLPRHPKTIHVALMLDIPEPQVVGHLVFMWLWAIDNAEDGRLPKQPRVVERLVGWQGAPGALISAFEEAGWVESSGDSLTIHDWDDYAGRLMQKREKDRTRKEEWRADQQSRNGTGTRTSHGRPTDVTVTALVNSNSDSDSDKEEEREVEKEPDSGESGGHSLAREIFGHWQTVMDKPKAKLTRDRRGKIEARLKEGYSVEDCKQAINGCKESDWHMHPERNETARDITNILQTGSKLEGFRDRPKSKSTLEALKDTYGGEK